MAGLSPTQRTLRALREEGCLVDVCERWLTAPHLPGGGYRKDMFGFIDLISIDPDGFRAIQSCGTSFSDHIRKLTDSECTENVIAWLKAGGKIHLYGWRKVKLKKGGKAMRWRPRIAVFKLDGENLTYEELK